MRSLNMDNIDGPRYNFRSASKNPKRKIVTFSAMKSHRPQIFVDAHVHFHECFDLSIFLESAYDNCKAQTIKEQHHDPFVGVLLLTESAWDHWFHQLTSYADKNQTFPHHSHGHWSFHHTNEDFTLFARSTQGATLLIAAGRQIVTKEKLEVLALLTGQIFQDGIDIEEAITQVKHSGGIPVIPWGFGKWWGTRGKLLSELMQSSVMTGVFLGDNSGRPSFLPYPSQFTLANKQGIRIFPGSDPLPFASENWRPCSVGFSAHGELDEVRPGADLNRLMQDPHASITPYFRHEQVYRFIRNQVAMQMVKHRSPQS